MLRRAGKSSPRGDTHQLLGRADGVRVLTLVILALGVAALVAASLWRDGAPAPLRSAVARSPHGCTIYVTPSGRARTQRERAKRPTTLQRAHRKAVPGSVICLLPGTYHVNDEIYLERSGRPGRPIVYRSARRSARLQWTGPRPPTGESNAVFKLGHGAHDVVISGLTIDGADRASQGVKCNSGGHHLVVRNSVIRNTGAAGVATKKCDYVTVEGNQIHHTGYDPNVGWSSAVSLNSHVWSDEAGGFHSYVVGNKISGASDESSYHSEGHGVILDLGGNAPPVLVANNVVYENGAHCIKVLDVANAWVVGNTCYQNGLDFRQPQAAEISAGGSGAVNAHFINNVVSARPGHPPFELEDGATASFASNVEFGGTTSSVPPATIADPAQLRWTDPQFLGTLTPVAHEASALPPWKLGARLAPARRSGLARGGIDPLQVAGVTPALRPGLRHYGDRDVTGRSRRRLPQWGIGAYGPGSRSR